MGLQSFNIRDRQQRKQTVEVLFEDRHLVVIDKPAGLLVIPDRWDSSRSNLRDLLQAKYQKISGRSEQAVWVVHRLDAETSGIVLLARSPEMHRALNQLFESRRMEKTYLAITRGHPPQDKGIIDLPLRPHPARRQIMEVHRRGKPARTRYRVLEIFKHFSLLKVAPASGRTHQIRVHLAAIQCPLAIDSLYGNKEPLTFSQLKPPYQKRDFQDEGSYLVNRLTLHAAHLVFDDPLSGSERSFEAPLAKDLMGLLKALRKWNIP